MEARCPRRDGHSSDGGEYGNWTQYCHEGHLLEFTGRIYGIIKVYPGYNSQTEDKEPDSPQCEEGPQAPTGARSHARVHGYDLVGVQSIGAVDSSCHQDGNLSNVMGSDRFFFTCDRGEKGKAQCLSVSHPNKNLVRGST